MLRDGEYGRQGGRERMREAMKHAVWAQTQGAALRGAERGGDVGWAGARGAWVLEGVSGILGRH